MTFASRLRSLYTRWRAPLGIALGTKLVFFVINYAAFLTRSPTFLGSLHEYLSLWNQWDSPRYLQIARDGYVATGEDAKNIVFYPLYPALVALMDAVVRDQIVAALVVSTLVSVAMAVVVYELARLDLPDDESALAVLLLFAFPTGYFLHVYYTEGVFLLCAAGFFLAYRRLGTSRRAGAWMAAAGVLAGLSRINGLSLVVAGGAESLWRRRWKAALLAATPVVGFVAYLVANRVVQGSFTAYSHWLESYWHKSFAFPWNGVWSLLQIAPQAHPSLELTYRFAEPAFWLLSLALTVVGLWRLPASYSLFSLTNLALFVSTGWLMSTPRYVLVLFPQYLVLARLLSGRPVAQAVWLMLSFGLQLTFSSHFMLGQWAF